MIPAIVPPLTGLSVLVTRPAPQGAALAANIASLGGEGIVFPSLVIEPIDAAAPAPHDLVIFVSVHAVEHGAKLIPKSAAMRVAAIGKATAAALTAAGLAPHVVPAKATSEGLLDDEAMRTTTASSVLIVRGSGGRETMRDAFLARGASVTTLEVYQRTTARVAAHDIAALEARWLESGIDIVTATSVETYLKLAELLSDRGRELLHSTTLLAPSDRIIEAARANGWQGDALVSGGADDEAILGVLARWRTRARN